MYANEKRIQLSVDTSTVGDNTLIAAPGSGKYLAIDYVVLIVSGGAQEINLLSGSTNLLPADLDDNQTLLIDNTIHDPEGVFKCADNEAFILNLGAATRVTGYIKYRVHNN